ncbi:phosphoethanolamine transferase [Pseudobowmanella zhangzhouensis]|uniref:phosphoethanolamine transferase n=1 Tax=Pseudobowmanella zhangzhouensis TaxID=1537679 RepID=UPI003610FC17
MRFKWFNALRERPLQSHWMIALLALLYTGIYNLPFFKRLIQVSSEDGILPVGFLLAAVGLIFCLQMVLFSLLLWPKIGKGLIVITTLLAAPVMYAGWAYGTLFNYDMIENIMQTNQAEASSYFSLSATLVFLLTGLLPVVWIMNQRVQYRRWYKELAMRIGMIAAAAISLWGIAQFYYQDFAITGRNHTELRRLLSPFEFSKSTIKYVRANYFIDPTPFSVLDESPTLDPQQAPDVMVLMLGETARAQNMAYYGYGRNTNEYTAKHTMRVLPPTQSCGTATAVSVPCMFSFLSRSNYDADIAQNQDNILDIAQRAYFAVSWIDDDGGCKGVCARVPTITVPVDASDPLCDGHTCFDEVLVRELQQVLATPSEKPRLIVMHMIGSHGPTYYKRYPADFARFLPDCPRADIQHCSQQEIINSYDNTLLYTDFVLSGIIDTLAAHPQLNSQFVYISDHGESLGEDNYYLHGLPYDMAPEVQKRVPWYLWQNQGVSPDCPVDAATISHDNLSHTLLGLLGVQSSVYDPALDLFNGC